MNNVEQLQKALKDVIPSVPGCIVSFILMIDKSFLENVYVCMLIFLIFFNLVYWVVVPKCASKTFIFLTFIALFLNVIYITICFNECNEYKSVWGLTVFSVQLAVFGIVMYFSNKIKKDQEEKIIDDLHLKFCLTRSEVVALTKVNSGKFPEDMFEYFITTDNFNDDTSRWSPGFVQEVVKDLTFKEKIKI